MQNDPGPRFTTLNRVKINQIWLIRGVEISLTGNKVLKVLMVGEVLFDVIDKATSQKVANKTKVSGIVASEYH